MKKEKLIFFVLLGLVLMISGFLFNIVFTNKDVSETKNIIGSLRVEDFKNKLSSDVILIDIRTLSEYNSGHIEGAKNIDYYSNSFKAKLGQLDRSKTYLIYCRSGSRTGNTLEMMKNMGFREVYDLDNGIISWKGNGFELLK